MGLRRSRAFDVPAGAPQMEVEIMQSLLTTLVRRPRRLAATCAVLAAIALFSSPSLAAAEAPSSQPSAKQADSGTGGSVGMPPTHRHAGWSEQRPSTTDDVRLRMEVYTGNNYSD